MISTSRAQLSRQLPKFLVFSWLVGFCLLAVVLVVASNASAHTPLVAGKPPKAAGTGTDDIYSIKTKWTTAQGKAFHLKELKGKKSIITLFYTQCSSICPMTVKHMKNIEQALGDQAKHVQFVMVTIDPRNDKVTEMKAYAEKHNAGQWKFLAGTDKETKDLAADLTLGYGAKPGNENLHQMHSLEFALVGADGKLLGKLPTMDPNIEKARELLK